MFKHDITYTFPADCGIPALAGQTCTGGYFDQIVINGRREPVVRFATRIAGKRVMARIAGKPALEALYAEHQARQARKASTLEALGWPRYRAIQAAAINAAAEYEAASEHGYPVREAAAAKAADAALAEARRNYPGAAAYALAESYSLAAHPAKAAAGRTAMAEIEEGIDPVAVIEAMQAAWRLAAEEADARA